MMVILPGREDVLEDTTQARGLELGRHFGTSVIESTFHLLYSFGTVSLTKYKAPLHLELTIEHSCNVFWY